MKKIFKTIIVLIVSLSLLGCSNTNSAKGVTESFFKAIKNGDENLLKKVYIEDNTSNQAITQILQIGSETKALGELGKFVSKFILDFDYKVLEVKEDGDEASAKVHIVTEDWKKILEDNSAVLATKAFSLLFDGKSENKIKKELEKMIKEYKDSTKDIEFDVNMKLKKVDKEWKVDLTEGVDTLLNGLYG